MPQSLRTPFLLQRLRTVKIDTSRKQTDQTRPTSPIYGHSNHPSYKIKVKTKSKMVSCKKWKKSQAMFTQSINQPLNNMGVCRLGSKNGMHRLWDIPSYLLLYTLIHSGSRPCWWWCGACADCGAPLFWLFLHGIGLILTNLTSPASVFCMALVCHEFPSETFSQCTTEL